MYTKLEAEYQAMEEKLPYKTMEEAEEHLREITGKLELVRNNYETVTRCLTEKQNKEKELEGQQKTRYQHLSCNHRKKYRKRYVPINRL